MKTDAATTPPLVVIGGGGHARVLIDALRQSGSNLAGVLDPRLTPGATTGGASVLGGDDWLESPRAEDCVLVNGVGANPAVLPRSRLYERWRARGFRFATVRHPSAIMAADVRLGEGVQILARAVLQAAAALAENVVINTGAIVEHDCEIGAHAFIAPGAIICGGVHIGANAFVGAGAIVLPGVRIGDGAMIAAGATVVRDVAADARVRGAPAENMSERDAKPVVPGTGEH